MELTGTENAVYEGADVPLDDADEGNRPFEGDNAVEQAVEALQTKREAAARQRPRSEPEDEADPNVTKVVWKDPEKVTKPLSTKDAAEAYSLYRQELAAQILQGAQSDFDAKQAEEAQAAEPEQITAETQEQSAEEHWNSYFQNLAPEAKAQITSAIELQNRAVVADEWASSYVLALNDLVGRINGQTTNAFADIRTPQDVARLKETEPQRFALLEQQMAATQAVHAEAQRVRAAHQQQQAEAFRESYKVYAAEQDKAVEAVIPELSPTADRETQARLKKAAREVLTDAGFSENELYGAWVHGQPLYLRDARSQRIVSDAARWKIATSREARNDLRAKRVFAPQPQRPGTSNTGDTASFHQERNLSERLRATGSVEDAVRLYRARHSSGRK